MIIFKSIVIYVTNYNFLSTKILQVKKGQNHDKTYMTEVIKSISNKCICKKF